MQLKNNKCRSFVNIVASRKGSSQYTKGTALLVIILRIKILNDLDVQFNTASLQCRGILGESDFAECLATILDHDEKKNGESSKSESKMAA